MSRPDPATDVPADLTVRTNRGWDLFVGLFTVVVGLTVSALYGPQQRWAVSVVVLLAWYILVGRRALRTRALHWQVIFAIGCLVILCWGISRNAWTAPLQGLVLVMLWWLALPNRRLAILWSVLVPLASTAGMILFSLVGPHGPWTFRATVINWVIFPIVIITASIVIGFWAESFFSWGRDRLALVDDLRQTEAQRIALAQEAAAAGERLRMAQEIHDTIAQDVVGLRFLVERARRQAASDNAGSKPANETMEMITAAIDTLLTETRVLITTTMPPLESSFREAFSRIVARFSRDTGIVIDMDVDDVRLSQESQVVFVRCLQEGLSNVRKHAEASRVWVSVSIVGDRAVMTLTDNGIGMEPGSGDGFGLPGMAERVRLAGGSFSVESPGLRLGVTMRVQMPVHAASAPGVADLEVAS